MHIFYNDHLRAFIGALAFGTLISCIYDLFRIIRKLLKHKTYTVIIEDLVFCLITICTITYYFNQYNEGVIRLYLCITLTFAFFIWHNSLGKLLTDLICVILKPIIDIICKFFGKSALFLKKLFIFVSKRVIILKKCLLKRKGGENKSGKNGFQRFRNSRENRINGSYHLPFICFHRTTGQNKRQKKREQRSRRSDFSTSH